jgi:hypothetical protein
MRWLLLVFPPPRALFGGDHGLRIRTLGLRIYFPRVLACWGFAVVMAGPSFGGAYVGSAWLGYGGADGRRVVVPSMGGDRLPDFMAAELHSGGSAAPGLA